MKYHACLPMQISSVLPNKVLPVSQWLFHLQNFYVGICIFSFVLGIDKIVVCDHIFVKNATKESIKTRCVLYCKMSSVIKFPVLNNFLHFRSFSLLKDWALLRVQDEHKMNNILHKLSQVPKQIYRAPMLKKQKFLIGPEISQASSHSL